MLDRDEDMLLTGGRHPFYAKYKVGGCPCWPDSSTDTSWSGEQRSSASIFGSLPFSRLLSAGGLPGQREGRGSGRVLLLQRWKLLGPLPVGQHPSPHRALPPLRTIS